jgi:hypothetical protein
MGKDATVALLPGFDLAAEKWPTRLLDAGMP